MFNNFHCFTFSEFSFMPNVAWQKDPSIYIIGRNKYFCTNPHFFPNEKRASCKSNGKTKA